MLTEEVLRFRTMVTVSQKVKGLSRKRSLNKSLHQALHWTCGKRLVYHRGLQAEHSCIPRQVLISRAFNRRVQNRTDKSYDFSLGYGKSLAVSDSWKPAAKLIHTAVRELNNGLVKGLGAGLHVYLAG
jgi:hypothetical protein